MTTRSEDEAPTERYDTRRGVTVWARRQERPRSEACDVRVCRSHCHRVCPQRARSETLRTAAPAQGSACPLPNTPNCAVETPVARAERK